MVKAVLWVVSLPRFILLPTERVSTIREIPRVHCINNQGDTPRALWRRSGINAPVELIEGVRDLQVLFGVDSTPNDNIRSANRYLNFDALNPTDVVRSLRVTITASTVNAVTDNGNVVTRTYSQTVSIRNC